MRQRRLRAAFSFLGVRFGKTTSALSAFVTGHATAGDAPYTAQVRRLPGHGRTGRRGFQAAGSLAHEFVEFPKTEAGARSIGIDAKLAAELSEWKLAQKP